MDSVGIREPRARTGAILRRVSERKECIEMTNRGTVVARLVPVFAPPTIDRPLGRRMTDLDRISAEISKHWPEGVRAVDAVREQPWGLSLSLGIARH